MSISINDIPILVKLFFPAAGDFVIYSKKKLAVSDLPVFNTEDDLNTFLRKASNPLIVVNLSTEQLTLQNCQGVIQYGNWKGGQQFSWINNPDGSIRWLFPTTQKEAYFLHLYNSSGWRGKLFSQGARILFSCGLDGFLQQGQISVFAAKPLWIDQLCEKHDFDHYAIFTGTKGENRKAVIALGEKKAVKYFAKLPLTIAAERLTATAEKQLKQAHALQLSNWLIPQVLKSESALLVSNVQNKGALGYHHLKPQHIHALEEVYIKDGKIIQLEDLAAWTDIVAIINQLHDIPKHPAIAEELSNAIFIGLTASFKSFKAGVERVPIALAHGDFTPWNMFVSKDKISIYDWELSDNQLIWYDAYHFILQSHILIHRSDARTIQKEVDEFNQQPAVVKLCEKYGISPQQTWQYYLLRHISYYLPRYLKQTALHQQVYWQLETWQKLLKQSAGNNKGLPVY